MEGSDKNRLISCLEHFMSGCLLYLQLSLDLRLPELQTLPLETHKLADFVDFMIQVEKPKCYLELSNML